MVGRLRRAAETLTAEGADVRHVGSTYLPTDELCLHLLEAESATTIGEASRRGAVAAGGGVEGQKAPPPDEPRGWARGEP